MTSAPEEPLKNPGVNFPPPILFALPIVAGVFVEAVFPYPLSRLVQMPMQTALGWVAMVLGGGLLLWALRIFISSKTAIYPNQAAGTLVARGPYRFSRNPMYVALAFSTVGVSLLADNLWMLLLLPVALLLLTLLVIRHEEAYLKAEFGAAYCDYKTRVRRWL